MPIVFMRQDQFPKQTPLRILDIGTGSGCLLLSALAEFPLATGVGIDISPGALAVAQQNAVNNALDQRVQFLHRDLETLSRLEEETITDEALYRCFDVILCNPPYIPRQELHLIAPDVLEHEPHLALFADGGLTASSSPSESDPEGLRMYQLLQKSIANLFRSDPTSSSMAEATAATARPIARCLLLEIGSEAQARAVQKLFTASATSQAASRDSASERLLKFERFLFDASGKYRGLLFLAP
ncbi:hypothetical protein BBJ28_00007010 [Nothophytophthora sp. Chile5]|nr:hypothetical protein BBJ28_00007010 [Nothophytophthora sp. Chile5]